MTSLGKKIGEKMDITYKVGRYLQQICEKFHEIIQKSRETTRT